jgi:hypothetical protein
MWRGAAEHEMGDLSVLPRFIGTMGRRLNGAMSAAW